MQWSNGKYPSNLGEWDKAIESLTIQEVKDYANALSMIHTWQPFKAAFGLFGTNVIESMLKFVLDHNQNRS